MDRQAAFARTLRHVRDLRGLTYDRRGYARSVQVPGPYTVAANAQDLIDVVTGAVLAWPPRASALRLEFARAKHELP